LAGGQRLFALASRGIEKLDLLFVVDNSLSMADKQKVLAKTLPDVLARLISPSCVDREGAIVSRPASSAEACPQGTAREFEPVGDLHVGVISTSLGGFGSSSSCLDDGSRPSSEQRVDM